MYDSRLLKGAFQLGYATATAGTVITALIPPKTADSRIRVTKLAYRSAGTAHDVFLMRPVAHQTVATSVAAAGTSVVLDAILQDAAGGNDVAANDYIAVQLDNGVWHLSTVSSWTEATLTLVMNTAVPTSRSIRAGTKVYLFGISTDAWNQKFETTASVVTEYADPAAGVFQAGLPSSLFAEGTYDNRSGFGDPVLFYSGNATAAGFLRQISGVYSKV